MSQFSCISVMDRCQPVSTSDIGIGREKCGSVPPYLRQLQKAFSRNSTYLVIEAFQSQAFLWRSIYQELRIVIKIKELRWCRRWMDEFWAKKILKRTWRDLHLNREDDELVLIWSVGFDPDESRVVVRVSRREAGSHHPLRLERRNLLEGGGGWRQWDKKLIKTIKGCIQKRDSPKAFRCLLVGQWEALNADLLHWSTSPPPEQSTATSQTDPESGCRFTM